MKHLTVLLFCLISLTSYSKIYHSVKDGNFDNPNIWLERQIPTFKGDTINIRHAVYMKRKNDTIKSVKSWYELTNRINIEKDGVLCMRNENYVIYSVFYDIKGQLYANKTIFMYSGFDITGYVSCDEQVSWREVQKSIFHGYGFNIGIYEVEDNCSIISNETQGFDTNCRKTAFVLIDSPIDELTSKYIVFSNLKINTKLIFPDTTYISNSDEGVIYKRKTKDSLKMTITATDSCNNFYTRKYSYSPLKNSSITDNLIKNQFEIKYIKEAITITTQEKDVFQLLLFDLSAKVVAKKEFKNDIDIDCSNFNRGIYLINIFNSQGRIQMCKKIEI